MKNRATRRFGAVVQRLCEFRIDFGIKLGQAALRFDIIEHCRSVIMAQQFIETDAFAIEIAREEFEDCIAQWLNIVFCNATFTLKRIDCSQDEKRNRRIRNLRSCARKN